jgi:ABC-2 type transport system ATP-binding protein
MNAVLKPVVTNNDRLRDNGDAVASLAHVTKRYKDNLLALDDVSLELRSGGIVALLGPNGAGKSTTVKLLMGLTAPSNGRVRIFGGDPRFARNRLRTGVMLQVGRAPDMLRVREHIEIMRGYYPHPLPFDQLVSAAGLEGTEGRLFGQLSGGQKQRVLFALALAGDADLIFLDEPTVGLDVEARRGMWAQIRALRARGKTILLTTHYLEEADALADRIVVLNAGRVICEGSPSEVKSIAAAMTAKADSSRRDGFPSKPDTIKLLSFETQLSYELIGALPGVERVSGDGASVTLASSHPEQTLRELLALDSNLSNLEVRPPALEEAFLALTNKR